MRQDIGFQSIQEVDFNEVYKGCSVFCEMIVTPEQARRKTVAACQAALTKRGVAVLVVPADIANAAAHDEAPYAVHARRPLVRPSDADLDEIAAILNESDAITIYAGAGCEGAHDEVVATAARLKAPMAHTSRGKDFVEYDNPYNVGMTGMIGGPAGYHAILDCDVLLLLGADFAWSQFYPDKAKIIQIDADPTHIGRRHPVTIGAVGDIKTTLDALLPRLAQHEDNAFLAQSCGAPPEGRGPRRTPKPCPVRTPPFPGPTSPRSSTSMRPRMRCSRSTTARCWSGRFAISIPAASGGPSAACCTARWRAACRRRIGLQKCQPGRQVVCMAGDGGFTMLLGDLLTVVQENLPIKIVVFDNGKLGFIDIEQKSAGMEPIFTDLKNPDFGKVAKAMGLWGRMRLEGRRARGSGIGLARAARSGSAGREGQSDAAGDAALAVRASRRPSSEWRSTPPRPCCTARATTSGK